MVAAAEKVSSERRRVRMAAAEPLEDGNVLQSFWGLASTDDKERIDSARDLLTALSNKQVRLSQDVTCVGD